MATGCTTSLERETPFKASSNLNCKTPFALETVWKKKPQKETKNWNLKNWVKVYSRLRTRYSEKVLLEIMTSLAETIFSEDCDKLKHSIFRMSSAFLY